MIDPNQLLSRANTIYQQLKWRKGTAPTADEDLHIRSDQVIAMMLAFTELLNALTAPVPEVLVTEPPVEAVTAS